MSYIFVRKIYLHILASFSQAAIYIFYMSPHNYSTETPDANKCAESYVFLRTETDEFLNEGAECPPRGENVETREKRGESRTGRAFANSDHMEDRKGARQLRPPPRSGKWILPTETYALLAVSSRRSCTNRGRRDRGKGTRRERERG